MNALRTFVQAMWLLVLIGAAVFCIVISWPVVLIVGAAVGLWLAVMGFWIFAWGPNDFWP